MSSRSIFMPRPRSSPRCTRRHGRRSRSWADNRVASTRAPLAIDRPADAECPLSRLRNSLLTLRAPERRTSVLGKALHQTTAFRGVAFLALAVVDLKRVLEIAEFTRSLAMIAQRRAAGLDRLVQHRVDSSDETPGMVGRLALSRGQRSGQTTRREMRAEQRLADINVAQPGDDALIKQRRLQAGFLVRA